MSTLSLSSNTFDLQEHKDMEELHNSAKREKEEKESTSSVTDEDESEGEYDEDEDEIEYDEDEDVENDDGDVATDEGDMSAELRSAKGEESEDEFWHEEPEDDMDKDLLTILTREQVVERQLALVESVASELGRDMWEAALLLQHFNWNLDRLHAKFWDNPARIMRAAGIYLSQDNESELGGSGVGHKSEPKKKRKKKKKTADGTKPKKKKKKVSPESGEDTTQKKKKGSGKKKKKRPSTSAGEVVEKGDNDKGSSSKKLKDEKSPKKKKSGDVSDEKKKGSKRPKKHKEKKDDTKGEKEVSTSSSSSTKPAEQGKEAATQVAKGKTPRKGIKLLSSRLTKRRSGDKIDGKRVERKERGKKLSRKEKKELAKLGAEGKTSSSSSAIPKGDETTGGGSTRVDEPFDYAKGAREREKEEQDKEPLPVPPAGDCSWMDAESAECLVCCDDAPRDELFALPCKHGPYCKICWSYHLGVAVQSSGAAGILNLTCMWPSCPIKLTYDSFKKLGTPEDFARYLYFWTKNYVDNNKDFSACPNPSCTNIIYFSGTGKPALLVKCTCGHQFCFACGMENHNPVTCDQLDKWQQRNSDDQESLKLIMATTKRCFHCNIPTTRTDGCNHMTCRKEQGGCGGQWCWMCRGDWKTHGPHTGGFYSCNKYDTSDAKKQDDEAAKLKAESDRYLHYFERYFAHSTASKNIKDQLEKAERRALEYAAQNNTNADFFVEAVKLLARCRHVLKYTHVYGYYLPDGSKGKDFFEYLQANAEGITERLADMVNAPSGELNIPDFKNRIRVTNEYINNLVRAMEDGLGVEGLGQMK